MSTAFRWIAYDVFGLDMCGMEKEESNRLKRLEVATWTKKAHLLSL